AGSRSSRCSRAPLPPSFTCKALLPDQSFGDYVCSFSTTADFTFRVSDRDRGLLGPGRGVPEDQLRAAGLQHRLALCAPGLDQQRRARTAASAASACRCWPNRSQAVSRAYGVLKADEGVAYRGLFIISDRGLIRQVTINETCLLVARLTRRSAWCRPSSTRRQARRGLPCRLAARRPSDEAGPQPQQGVLSARWRPAASRPTARPLPLPAPEGAAAAPPEGDKAASSSQPEPEVKPAGSRIFPLAGREGLQGARLRPLARLLLLEEAALSCSAHVHTERAKLTAAARWEFPGQPASYPDFHVGIQHLRFATFFKSTLF
uniref:FGF n=1 Tax=Macrostomum lignano TaxID=282301 RepID=A0A1I8FFY5_9PLAT